MPRSKILITGVTGQVAAPVARALATDNEVWGIARFTDAAARAGLEKAGVRCQSVNLAAGDFTAIPSDFDYVLNFAVAKSGNWDKDLGANAESIPKLLAVASVPATTLNWAGDQLVSVQEWCAYLGTLVGKEPVFAESDQALRGNPVDLTRMRELIGSATTVDWRDGLRRMVAGFHPELAHA
ncbi:NAD-dependent epimerase/dehydratase family protein [Mycobacterium attenuatum]|uniref:NAD-dependent epimerase/dehydratase family protein n=1 Tax=Mycobacterium attenuatum TaxID=2341086 RepID=UPI000F01A757|nr:NAD-dependent epimerase/dehydratase family protein [Mycobacterium attenuatum]